MIGRLTVLALALTLAGCGGDDGGSSASEEYANSACGELSTWVTSLQDTTNSLAEAGLSINSDAVQSAFSDVSDATNALVDDLRGLGPPESEEGQQAKSELDSLSTKLEEHVDTVQQAVDENTGVLDLATTVTTTVSTATNDVKSTVDGLQNLNPPGELKDAFTNSDECSSLRDQIENVRSGS